MPSNKPIERKDQMPGLAIRLTNGRALPIEFVTRLKHGSNNDAIHRLHSGGSREIEFAHLPSGTVIDLVRDSSGELVFSVFQDGATSIQREVHHEDFEFIPPQVDSNLSRAVRFPTAVGSSHTARELLFEIEDVFHLYADYDLSDRKLLAHFALYSWIADLLPIAPYIWVVGPYGYGKTTLLQIMSAICRRSILAGDISLASLYRVATQYHPTLILDELEAGKDSSSRHLLRLLRAGSTMGQKVLRASKAYDLFGPKIIASRLGTGDAALESRGFFVVARPLSKNVSGLTPSSLESIAEQLQPKLAAFRLNNYARLKSASGSFTLRADSSPKVQDMARALALPIIGDTELESQVLTIVEAHGRQAYVGRDNEPEWFVAVTLLNLAHLLGPGAPNRWTAKMISDGVQSNAQRRGESYNPKPRKVGEILRSLGLNTKPLGSPGRGLESSAKLKDQIHEIAKGLGICAGDLLTPEFQHAPLTCARCEKYGLNFDNGGRNLGYEPFSHGPEDPDNPTPSDE